MAQSKQPCAIPKSLSAAQFNEFVCPFLTEGRRGPKPKVALHTMFNYILRILYLGCPWKELSIAHGLDGEPEIHYTHLDLHAAAESPTVARRIRNMVAHMSPSPETMALLVEIMNALANLTPDQLEEAVKHA